MILANYTHEMQAIIKPLDKYSLMRVDRNDIWFNMKDIISACQEISHFPLNLNYLRSYDQGFAKSEEEKYREERNYRKLEEICDDLIPRYKRKLAVQIDALNDVYNRKIVPFENKDDEYGKKASWLCEKYSSFWERIRANFRFTIKTAIDLVRGAGMAIIGLVQELLPGIVVYTSSAVVLAVTAPFNVTPKWAQEIFTETNAAIDSILKDPMLIVEGISQQVSDTIEEEGVAYCIGYVGADIWGAKGLHKLAGSVKTKLFKKNKIVEDIGDGSKGGVKSNDIGYMKNPADPMRDVLGSGRTSKPKEWDTLIRELEASGVEINYCKGSMAYAPGLRKGNPGQIKIDPDASLSALKHEYQHFLDARAEGFPSFGQQMFEDPSSRVIKELRAYMVEIKEAEKMGLKEVAEQLFENYRQEREWIVNQYILPGGE